jgi:hypothetical protein
MSWAQFTLPEAPSLGAGFRINWTASRAFILAGESPYSDLVALRNQVAIYGRSAQPGEPELHFTSPLYATAVVAPFSLIPDFDLARALWSSALQVAVLALLFICLPLTGWRPALWLLLLLLLFSLLWYHALSAILNGSLVILAAVLAGGCLLALKDERDELAGVLLAFATIKPQVVLLLVLFVLFWTLSRRKWALIFWFMVGLIFLFLGGMFFNSTWPLEYLLAVQRYLATAPLNTPAAIFSQWWPGIGLRLGWGLSGLMAIILLIEWYLARGQNFRWFLWTACLTLVISQWIGIPTNPHNYFILFIPLMLVLASWEGHWASPGRLVIVLLLLVVFFGLWALFYYTSRLPVFGDPHPLMFFPLPAMLLVGLYWVRFWAVRPSHLLIETLRSSQS